MDFEEFVTLLGPKLSTSGIPEKFHGTDFDTVFWKVRREQFNSLATKTRIHMGLKATVLSYCCLANGNTMEKRITF